MTITFNLTSRQVEIISNYLKLIQGETITNKNFIAMKPEIEEIIKLLS